MRKTIITLAAVVSAAALAWVAAFGTYAVQIYGPAMAQTACLEYASFILDRTDAGMSPEQIEALWADQLAADASTENNLSQLCGSVSEIATH